MKSIFKKKSLVFLLLIFVLLVMYFFYQPNTKISNYKSPNEINAIYKTDLTNSEKEQVLKSVDSFMNEYKLPEVDSGNSYTLVVEKRLGKSMLVIVNPDDPGSDFYSVIYLKNSGGFWEVDATALPSCKLEDYENNKCE